MGNHRKSRDIDKQIQKNKRRSTPCPKHLAILSGFWPFLPQENGDRNRWHLELASSVCNRHPWASHGTPKNGAILPADFLLVHQHIHQVFTSNESILFSGWKKFCTTKRMVETCWNNMKQYETIWNNGMFTSIFNWCRISSITGGWATPVKNMSQLGWKIITLFQSTHQIN